MEEAAKYWDLVMLLVLLDKAEAQARKLSGRFSELEAITESVSEAAGLCDLALTIEDIKSIDLSTS